MLGAPRMSGAPSFRFFPATGPLGHFVEYLYASDVPAEFLAQIEPMRLPEVEAQLVFALEEGSLFPGGQRLSGNLRACLFLQPAHLQMIPIPGSIRAAIGAALRPAGLRILLPKGAGELFDAPLIALEDVYPVEGRELLERMIEAATPERQLQCLDQFLRQRLAQVPAPSRAVARALDLIGTAHGEISTEQLAESCGITSRTLRKLAVSETGLSPKHLARVARIRHALDLLTVAGVPLSDAAVTAAFSDQAHMSREFRELIGARPSDVTQRLRQELPDHAAERRLMSTGLLILPKSGAI